MCVCVCVWIVRYCTEVMLREEWYLSDQLHTLPDSPALVCSRSDSGPEAHQPGLQSKEE